MGEGITESQNSQIAGYFRSRDSWAVLRGDIGACGFFRHPHLRLSRNWEYRSLRLLGEQAAVCQYPNLSDGCMELRGAESG